MTISRDDSLAIKGIAIVCMMMLHFWGYPSWINPEYMFNGVLLSNDIFFKIGGFGNVCVSLFTFLVGYGLCVTSKKWDNGKYRFEKILSFLSYYWIYCVIFWIVGLSIGETKPDVDAGIFNFFGLANEIGIEMCVPFAWYVGFYVVCLLLYPLMKKLFEKNRVVIIVVSLLTWTALYFLFMWMDSGINIYWVVWNFFRRFPAIINLLIGWYFAKYDVWNTVRSKTKKPMVELMAAVFFIILLVAIKLWLGNFMEGWLGLFYTLGIIYVCLRINLKKIPFLGKLFTILGKYSVGMWFISGLFYLPSGKLQKYAFLGGNAEPVLVIIWVTIVSFGISFLLTYVFNKIMKKI